MKNTIIVLTILIPIFSSWSLAYQEQRSILDLFFPIRRAIKTFTNTKWDVLSERKSGLGTRTPKNKFQNNSLGLDFPCDLNITLRSKERPKSAHTLRPGDIDVIGALGDSLTAGYGVGVNNLLAIIHEGRGSSFSIGGAGTWKSHLTLPNILKNYNQNIYGYSLNSISTDRRSKFNVAEGGARSADMPYMAKVLVKRIRNDKNVDLDKDWKMISVFIGHNDFCSAVCYRKDFDKVLRDHEKDMLEVLRTFRENLPRSVINLIPPLDLRILLRMTDKPQSCEIPHLFSCPCLIGLPHYHLRPKITQLMTKWQQLDLAIANYREFDGEDFTVIAHNFPLNFTIPRASGGGTDYGYVAADCFHASQRGHAKAANDLWNSLLEPYGGKSLETHREFERFLCPTDASPYIFTRRSLKYV